MCRCTPGIRTPFCGRPGCEWPNWCLGPITDEDLAWARREIEKLNQKEMTIPCNDLAYRLHVLANTVDDQQVGEEIERGANEIERLRAWLAEAKSALERAGSACTFTIQQRNEVVAERDRLRADAERYRWLRQRIEVRQQTAMSGSSRPGLDVRIGHGFLDRPVPNVRPQGRSKELSRELDAAIDAALAGGSKK